MFAQTLEKASATVFLYQDGILKLEDLKLEKSHDNEYKSIKDVSQSLDEVNNLIDVEIRYKEKEIIETMYYYSNYIITLILIIFSYCVYKNCKRNNRNNIRTCS